jgi:tetratricopeptide (TPR) repeat protein
LSNKVLALFLGVLILGVYLPSVRYDFVNIDDPTYITANFHVQPGLTTTGLLWAFTSFYGANWHPVTWMSHMLDCQVFGLKPAGHHLTSALIHATNSVLLFFLLKGITGSVWRSLAVAALFGLHPLRVESVAWVSERKDVLSTFFFILAMWSYCHFAVELHASEKSVRAKKPPVVSKAGHPRFSYFLALVYFAMGLMCKPMLVTVPFVFLLLDYWPLDRFTKPNDRPQGLGSPPGLSFWRLLIEKTPFFCLSIGSSVVTYLAQKQGGTVEPTTGFRFLFRLENASIAYVSYLGKLVYPTRLAVFYPRPDHWPAMLAVLAVLLIVGLSVFAFTARNRRPYLLVSWLWFLGTLVPVIGLVQVGTQAMADRYTYLPFIGILIFVVWGLSDLSRAMALPRASMPATSIVAAIICVLLTHHQLTFWRNSELLFTHALKVTRNNYVAHDSMGDVLAVKGLIEEAKEQYLEALRLRPTYWTVHNNLGLLLFRQGKYDDAILHYKQALEESPDNPDILTNLGNALNRKGNSSQAIACFQKALVADPCHPQALENLGRMLFVQGNVSEAINRFRQVLRINPNCATAHHNLSIALLDQGHSDQAIDHLWAAVRLDPSLSPAHSLLGTALASRGSLPEAEAQFRDVLRHKPLDPYALVNLGATLARQGRIAEALSDLREGTRLYPEDADAHLWLGRVLASQGSLEAAIAELRTVAHLRPADKRVEQALQALIADERKTNGP